MPKVTRPRMCRLCLIGVSHKCVDNCTCVCVEINKAKILNPYTPVSKPKPVVLSAQAAQTGRI